MVGEQVAGHNAVADRQGPHGRLMGAHDLHMTAGGRSGRAWPGLAIRPPGQASPPRLATSAAVSPQAEVLSVTHR